MDIGTKLRQARLEAGLSQRQLCEGIVTRNMLSQIENGSARPSMDTLALFASRLGKTVGFFLGEPVASGNARCIENARQTYARGEWAEAKAFLAEYQCPDGQLDDEWGLLNVLVLLQEAESARQRPIYARELLEQAAQFGAKTCYYTVELEQRRLLLLSEVSSEPISLPVDDRPLLQRAKRALQEGDGARCAVLLEACEGRDSGDWHYLRGEAAWLQGQYALAAEHYRKAEPECPKDCWPRLEACYRALDDYKMAYEYACKQRQI